jgi:hypothetical protein
MADPPLSSASLFAAYAAGESNEISSQHQQRPAWLAASSFSVANSAPTSEAVVLHSKIESNEAQATASKKRKKHKKSSHSHKKKEKEPNMRNDYGRSSTNEPSRREAIIQRAEANLRRRAMHGEVTWQMDNRGKKENLQFLRCFCFVSAVSVISHGTV